MKNNKNIIVVLAIVFILAIGIDIYLVLSNKNHELENKKPENTPISEPDISEENWPKNYTCLKTNQLTTVGDLTYNYSETYDFSIAEDSKIIGYIKQTFQFNSDEDYETFYNTDKEYMLNEQDSRIKYDFQKENRKIIKTIEEILPNTQNILNNIFTSEYFDVLDSFEFKNCQITN